MSKKRKLSKLLSDVAYREEQPEAGDEGRRLIERIIKRPIRSAAGRRGAEGPSARYSPWSREMLLARLATYSFKRWRVSDADALVNAAECAKHGWTCIDGAAANTVQCVYCLALLNINLGDSPDTQRLLAERYRAKVVADAHRPDCPWGPRPCADALYDALAPSRTQLESLTARRMRLQERLVSLDLGDNVVFPEEDMKIAEQQPALRLAVLGWDVDTVLNNGMAVLRCEACFRRVTVPPGQGQPPFDPAAEHTAYCPYSRSTEWRKLLACMNDTSEKQPESSSSSSSYKERLSKLRRIYFHR